ncbi:hypothetical protein [Reichenbachiella ulvae]|uniref:Uncharacterized protein n=1 Tax=Reichenbachiella ulvae TaxID=2980104 RepID=A0ABT3CP33_9BACT|nr:hypothetical protein [Reichenbachiella ulvae]MCV9385490.1 hypothetical protein [Reichenbachiella ulvae]
MWPLTDITVYYYGTNIQDTPKDWTFRKTVNYISDFYHNSLNGYKPPKTARICIRVDDQLAKGQADHFGALCQIYTTMNEQFYLTLSKIDQYNYLLNLIHESVSKAAHQFNWDIEVFNSAFNRVKNSNFKFIKEYDSKNSRDRKNTGQAILSKTEDTAKIILRIKGDRSQEIELIQKKNWFWYDSSYEIAKLCKWIDNNKFGYMNKKTGKFAYYSITSKALDTNMKFEESTF